MKPSPSRSGGDTTPRERALDDERRGLERQVHQKDSALIKLTEELEATREKLAQAETEAKSRALELKRTQDELKPKTPSRDRASLPGRPRPRTASVDSDSRRYVNENLTELENSNKAKDRELKEFATKVAMLERQIKFREKEIAKLSAIVEDRKSKEIDIPSLMSEKRLLEKKFEESQEAVRTISQVERAKTLVIEKLTNELESRKGSNDEVVDLQNALQEKNIKIQSLEDEVITLERVLQQKDIALDRQAAVNVSRDERSAWVEERRVLEGQKRKFQEKLAACEKLNKGYETRIHTLEQRINLFAKAVRDAPLRDGGAAAQDHSTSNGDGEAAHHDYSGEIDTVPAAMYATLEHTVLKLQNAVREKEAMVAERDDAIIMYQRKVDVLQKSNHTLEKRLVLDTSELRQKVDDLQNEVLRRDERIGVLEREAKTWQHDRAVALKSNRRVENELYGEIADLKSMQQRRDAEVAENEAILKKELADTKSRLEEENNKLKQNLAEMVSLHEDLRLASIDSRPAKVAVVIHSGTGAVRQQAESVAEGIRSVGNVDVTLYRVPSKSTPSSMSDLPIVTADMLTDVDGVVLGMPTYAGSLCEEMKTFLDKAAASWPAGSFNGRVGAAFVMAEIPMSPSPTQRQDPGLGMLQTSLLSHGMCIASNPPDASPNDEILAGKALGSHVGSVARRLVRGK